MSITKEKFNEKIGETKLDGISEDQLNILVTNLNAEKDEGAADVVFTMSDFGDSAKDHDGRLNILKEKFKVIDTTPEEVHSGKWSCKGKCHNVNVEFNEPQGTHGGKRRSRKRRSSKKKRKNKKSKKSRKAKKSRKSRK